MRGRDSILLPLGAHSPEHVADLQGAMLETKPSKNWISPPLQEHATIGGALPFVGLSIAILASIFYIFPAGTPQPGDLLLVVAIVGAVIFSNVRLPIFPTLYATLGAFLLWLLLVNSSWFILIGDYTFLRKTLFYFYNVAIMLFVVSLGMSDLQRLKRVVYWSCIAALCAELFYLEFVYHGAKMRSLGTFNNPNQMGYWGLLMLACIGVARRRQHLHALDAAALAIGCYVIAQTLSRAATAAGVLMALAVALSSRWQRSAILTILALGVLGGGAEFLRGGFLDHISQADVVRGLQYRISKLQKNPDDPLSLWKRGYGRLVTHPEYLAVGAGEGAFERLTDLKDKEFHSSLGNILLSYGAIGLGILFGIFYVTFRRAPFINIVYFGLIMLYGITHMGMRDTMLWIFLGLVFVEGAAEDGEDQIHAEDTTPTR